MLSPNLQSASSSLSKKKKPPNLQRALLENHLPVITLTVNLTKLPVASATDGVSNEKRSPQLRPRPPAATSTTSALLRGGRLGWGWRAAAAEERVKEKQTRLGIRRPMGMSGDPEEEHSADDDGQRGRRLPPRSPARRRTEPQVIDEWCSSSVFKGQSTSSVQENPHTESQTESSNGQLNVGYAEPEHHPAELSA